jgi:AraC family transcriptional regulator
MLGRKPTFADSCSCMLSILYGNIRGDFLAKIAVELERALAHRTVNGFTGEAKRRVLGSGEGWEVADVICTSGPQDRRFEEQHSRVSIAIVAAGSFQYRSGRSQQLMTPGSVLLGYPGQWFECGHEHCAGDRCLSFRYDSDYFERLTVDVGRRTGKPDFKVLRLPPLRALTPVVARTFAGVIGVTDVSWEEVGIQLAAKVLNLLAGQFVDSDSLPASSVARVTRVVRAIEDRSNNELGLTELAKHAGLSPYHFLRTFERLTGVTPHQYVLRARLRAAALRLCSDTDRVLDIALDAGFGDVSNFNRTFKNEFGVSPRVYRRAR